MDTQSFWEMLARVGLAIVAGAVLGFEREAKFKPAGLKTHMMVSLGSAGFVLAGLQWASEGLEGEYRFEMSRLIQGIVGGVGFLGAGSIVQARGKIRGITTAATIWVAAMLGVASGLGLYYLTATVVGSALLILVGFAGVERLLFNEAEKPLLDDEEES